MPAVPVASLERGTHRKRAGTEAEAARECKMTDSERLDSEMTRTGMNSCRLAIIQY